MLSRRNPNASHGLIRFPTHLRDTGEGGVSVFAVWPYVDNAVCAVDVAFYPEGLILDPWFEEETQARLRELLAHAKPDVKAVPTLEYSEFEGGRIVAGWRNAEMSPEVSLGVQYAEALLNGRTPCMPVAGAIYLGSSGGSWYDDDADNYWCASREDLSEAGSELIQALDQLYGVEGRLMTVLDT